MRSTYFYISNILIIIIAIRAITIITDHRPLICLFNVTDPGSRLIRWRLKLEEYDFEIIHKAGKGNINADALSRNLIPNDQHVYISRKNEEEEEEVREYTKTPDFMSIMMHLWENIKDSHEL